MTLFPGKEGEIQVLAGLAPSGQTVGSLLRTPAGKASQNFSAKCHFREFTSMEKYTRLFLIKRILQSQKFDKAHYYLKNFPF